MKTLSAFLLRVGFIAVLMATVGGCPPAVTAAQTNPITLHIRAGFDGYYKDGRWLPVQIEIANDGPDTAGMLRILAPRNDGAPVPFTRAVDLPTQARRALTLYIPMEGYASDITVTLVDANNKVLTVATARLQQLNPADLLYGVVANSPSTFGVLSGIAALNGSAYKAEMALSDLPAVAAGWEALDVLVFSDVDTGALSLEQRAALASWVAAGGRLLVAGGPAWQKTAAGVAELLPLQPTSTQTMRDWAALAALAGEEAPEGEAVVAVGNLRPEAVVIASGGAVPLVVTRRVGYGLVLYLAADPTFAPLKGWGGLQNLLRALMARVLEKPSWAGGFHDWYSARNAITALPGFELPSVFQICGFLTLYIVMVGPLNYLILKRLKRREWAWFTIPGIVVVFTGLTYLVGSQMRGTQAVLHRLAVVQGWAGAPWAQVDEIVGVYSPRRTGYDVQFDAGVLVRPFPSDGGYGLTHVAAVAQSDFTEIQDTRVDVGAVQAFMAHGQTPAPVFTGAFTLTVTNGQYTLQGSVINNSDFTLQRAVFLAPGLAQTLGDLAPGAQATVNLIGANTRALPAPLNAIAPIFSALPPAFISSPGYYPATAYDNTIIDILGNTNYYDNRLEYRRYSLLTALMSSYNGTTRGNGLYLAGWSETVPLEAEITNGAFYTVDETLYLIALPPSQLELSGANLTLPPGLLNWLVLDAGQMGSPTPYDMYLYQGAEYALQFMPALEVTVKQVARLTLHVNNYGATGAAGFNVALWDFDARAWEDLPNLQWGDTDLSAPDRFVGPAGEMQVRITNPLQPQINLEALDFTLILEQ